MAHHFSKKYCLMTWQLASAISCALAHGSTCVLNVTFTGIHDKPIDSRRDITQPIEEEVQEAWNHFRVDGPFCGRQGHCCATDVSVNQGAATRISATPTI